jgi:hypothetical protein
MDTEELLKEIVMLKEENAKLKLQLENYNNSRKSYYEKNKDIVNEKAKQRLKKTAIKGKNIIFLKQAAAKELGYKYEIWVYNDKGIRVEKYE